MKLATVVGARPQFVKAAATSPAIRRSHTEILIHTGQHYDYEMSRVFFEELDIPRPDFNLEVGSMSHGRQTGEILSRLEPVLEAVEPDALLVYGDTNSTLAAALCAVKMHIPVIHVEAGLRSYRKTTPEEVNRVATDHISSLLFCPVRSAVDILAAEGVTEGVHFSGDVMLDLALRMRPLAGERMQVLADAGVEPGEYYLATIHRPVNTDDPATLRAILSAFERAALPVVLPLHPRTRQKIAAAGIWPEEPPASVHVIEPQGYLDLMCLATNARKVVTDSGGLQKEAYFYGIPCLTCNTVSEWTETVEDGWNTLVGSDMDAILRALEAPPPAEPRKDHYGDGHAAEHIVQVLDAWTPVLV